MEVDRAIMNIILPYALEQSNIIIVELYEESAVIVNKPFQ
jgi:hypothetical protein